MSVNSPILHGYAVAFGLVCELYLSCVKLGFPTNKMRQTVNYIRNVYGTYSFNCNDYDDLFELMKHDKRMFHHNQFHFTRRYWKIKIDQTASKEEIFEAFDFFRESL